jgi:chromosome segregation ATPase
MTGASGENFILFIAIIISLSIFLIFYIRLTRRHSRLRIALETSTALEQNLRDDQFRWQSERHMLTEQLKALTTELANAQQDLIIIKQQNDSKSVHLREKNHQLTEQTKQLESEIDRLQEERLTIENDFMLANERWKKERQRLEQELTQAQEKLSRSQQKITLLETRFGDLKSWQEKCRNLQTQLDQVQGDNQALQNKLALQHKWAIEVQQALEEEVAQLSTKLKRTEQSVAK